MTEFGPLGDVRLDATFDGGAWNYRIVPQHLDAHGRRIRRRSRSSAAARARRVYASFNGSTETAVLERPRRRGPRTRSARSRSRSRNGFETAISLRNAPAHLAVKALDAKRRPIATSRIV